MRRRTRSGDRGTQYHRLEHIGDGQFEDEQFSGVATSPTLKPIPWKSIFLASFLFAGGTTLLVTGSLLVAGVLDEKYGDRLWPLIVLGLLMFIPGAYHVRIAYMAYFGHSGFSFDDIPSFD